MDAPLNSALDKALAAATSSYLACTKAVASRGASALASGPAGTLAAPATLGKASEQYRSNVGWVFVATKAIAQKIAEREVFVGTVGSTPKRQKSIGDDIEPMPAHPILDLLSDPNPLTTRWSLMYSTVASLLLTGRAHWWLPTEKGQPELWYLPSSWCEPKDPFRGSWVVRPKNASEGFEVAGDDLVYFSLPDPSDPFGCLSPLQSQAPAVATDEAIQVAQFRSFKNGIFPGVMIRAGRLPNMLGGTEGPRPVLTQAQRSELTEAIKKSYRGVQNYHEPLIVDGLIESVEKFSLTPAELDFLNSGQVTKARIFQAFGVSPFAVGQVENGNRAAMIVAQQTFAENVLNPLIALLSESMTAWLGPRYAGKGERLIVWVDPVVPKDSELDAQNWNNALRAGACSVNEYRRNVLNAADMPGGDKPLNPLDALVGNSVKAMAVDQVGTREAPEIYSWGWDLRNELEARRNGNGHAEAVR